MHGYTAPTTKLVTGREEAFARVALTGELLVLVAKLIPQVVEGFIVGTEDYVAESGRALLDINLA